MRFKKSAVTAGLLCPITATCLYLLAADGDPSAPAPARSAPLEWGVYQILWSRTFPDELNKALSKFATKPSYVMFYRDMLRPFPRFAIDSIGAVGATSIVSLELWSWHGGRKGLYLHAIAAGEYDDFFRQWAMGAKSYHKRVLLRFGFEFNGNWFTWSQDPPAFVAAWRRAHDILQKVGARNVEWVWAPNVVSCPDTPENDMHRYYPGDEFVDWIGVDGYNFGDKHDRWHKWQSFDEVFDSVLASFPKRYPDKPIMLTEFGCATGKPGQKEKWIREAFDSLQRHPGVRAAVWFNYDKRREGEPNFRIDATPASLKAFNETFAAGKANPPS
ncbi:MAG: hypothetical protein IH987_02855 [Planctomycetes bacterium]|nr:hypothetical protein [Planctomycetota bacterium]